MYKILKVDGTEEKCRGDLKSLQKAVGGYIETVPTIKGKTMYVNEEGNRLNLPINIYASELANRIIVGDVVLSFRKILIKKGEKKMTKQEKDFLKTIEDEILWQIENGKTKDDKNLTYNSEQSKNIQEMIKFHFSRFWDSFYEY